MALWTFTSWTAAGFAVIVDCDGPWELVCGGVDDAGAAGSRGTGVSVFWRRMLYYGYGMLYYVTLTAAATIDAVLKLPGCRLFGTQAVSAKHLGTDCPL